VGDPVGAAQVDARDDPTHRPAFVDHALGKLATKVGDAVTTIGEDADGALDHAGDSIGVAGKREGNFVEDADTAFALDEFGNGLIDVHGVSFSLSIQRHGVKGWGWRCGLE
jgi:hypothetical protein